MTPTELETMLHRRAILWRLGASQESAVQSRATLARAEAARRRQRLSVVPEAASDQRPAADGRRAA